MNKSARTTIRRVTTIAVTVVAVAGVGMTAAVAAPAAAGKATDTAPTVNYMGEVTNMTPYTWTFFPNGMWGINEGPYNVAPTQTVAPGQTAAWSPKIKPLSEDLVVTDYMFQDASGMTHIIDLENNAIGDQEDFYTQSYSLDHVNNQLDDSTSFHMALDPDGVPNHVDAVWNTPTTIKIDAKADPAAAALAVNTQLPRASANSTSFVYPQGEQPTVTHTDQTRATSQVINESSEPVTLYKGHEVTRGQSTSLGTEVTASVGADVFGAASNAAISVTSDKEWGSTDAFITDYDAEIAAGKMGWLDIDTSLSTMTGNLQFTTPEGITYQIENVSISQPGIAPLKGVPTGVNWTPDEGPIPGGM